MCIIVCIERNQLLILTLALFGGGVTQVALLAAAEWASSLAVANLILTAGVGEAGVDAGLEALGVHLAHLAGAAVFVGGALALAVLGLAACGEVVRVALIAVLAQAG